jgi:hypothetical protein
MMTSFFTRKNLETKGRRLRKKKKNHFNPSRFESFYSFHFSQTPQSHALECVYISTDDKKSYMPLK